MPHPSPLHRLALLAILLALTVGCAGKRPAAPEGAGRVETRKPDATQAPPAAVAEARKLVGTLASERFGGRAPGTEGIDRARDLLRDRFKGAGLQPAFGERFVQPFPVTMGAKVTEKRLGIGDFNLPDDRFNALGFGASAAFEAGAVFVGYSIDAPKHEYDSFAGLGDDALKGKVAVIYRYEPRDEGGGSRWTDSGGWTRHAHLIRKVRAVAERGAVAAIIVNPPSHADAKLHRAASTFGGRADIPAVMASQSVFQRMLKEAGVDNRRKAAEQWQGRADAGRPHARKLDLRIAGRIGIEPDRVTAHNVAALAPGAGRLAGRAIVVGAHYDHIGQGAFASRASKRALHPGADDNASGTAAMLLLAERYAARIAGPDAPKDRRAVLFVGFSAEERGLVGSRYFVNHLDKTGFADDQIVAMLNFDMVGRLREDKLTAIGVKSAEGWTDLLKPAAEAEGLTLETRGGGFGPSDQTNFYNVGVPVVHLFTGLHTDYHTPADTAEKINPAGIVRVVNVAERLVEALWTAEPQPLAYVSAEAGGGGRRHATGPRGEGEGGPGAFLGIMPDYAAADEATVGSALDGSPAEQAGLKPGDRLTHWNGQALDGLRHLAAKLADAEPGEKVTLTIERGDTTIERSVELGQRGAGGDG